MAVAAVVVGANQAITFDECVTPMRNINLSPTELLGYAADELFGNGHRFLSIDAIIFHGSDNFGADH